MTHHLGPRALALAIVMAKSTLIWVSTAAGAELTAAVHFDQRSVRPNQVVHLTGLACLTPDGSASRSLSPDTFWLVDTRADPPWNTAHLSEPGDWYAFGPAKTEADGSISADITVPNRRAGEYVFWWRCTGTGWHVSTGPTLVIKALPETDAAAARTSSASSHVAAVENRALLAAGAAAAFAALLALTSRNRRRRLR